MNYLAHLFLAENTPESIIGNLLGDFVKGAIGDEYPPQIRRGIELHRQVDKFTDAHPRVRSSKNLISPQRRRFAGIMVDMVYDHFLARNWAEYSVIPLPVFSQQIYTILTVHHEMLPERLQMVLPRMVSQDWLTSYRELSSIDTALNRIATRLKRENSLTNSAEELKFHYEQLESDFRVFFPELIHYVQNWHTESLNHYQRNQIE